jgi:small-conductance mechanosensitive channel
MNKKIIGLFALVELLLFAVLVFVLATTRLQNAFLGMGIGALIGVLFILGVRRPAAAERPPRAGGAFSLRRWLTLLLVAGGVLLVGLTVMWSDQLQQVAMAAGLAFLLVFLGAMGNYAKRFSTHELLELPANRLFPARARERDDQSPRQ